jgi:hypothetical protein
VVAPKLLDQPGPDVVPDALGEDGLATHREVPTDHVLVLGIQVLEDRRLGDLPLPLAVGEPVVDAIQRTLQAVMGPSAAG